MKNEMDNEAWAAYVAAAEFWGKVKDFTDVQSIICVLIDYTAAKENMTSVEFLDMIRPEIVRVNEERGQVSTSDL